MNRLLKLRNNQKCSTSIEKDNRNHINDPPRIGTLNEQLEYWNGQKVHIENHQHKLLIKIANLMAEYEIDKVKNPEGILHHKYKDKLKLAYKN